MNAGRLILLRFPSLLEGRDAQNERDGAAIAQQEHVDGATSQQQLRRSSTTT